MVTGWELVRTVVAAVIWFGALVAILALAIAVYG